MGYIPEQPALIDPALSREVLPTSQLLGAAASAGRTEKRLSVPCLQVELTASPGTYSSEHSCRQNIHVRSMCLYTYARVRYATGPRRKTQQSGKRSPARPYSLLWLIGTSLSAGNPHLHTTDPSSAQDKKLLHALEPELLSSGAGARTKESWRTAAPASGGHSQPPGARTNTRAPQGLD